VTARARPSFGRPRGSRSVDRATRFVSRNEWLHAATSLRGSRRLGGRKRRDVRLLRHDARVGLRRHRRAVLEPHAVDAQILDHALHVVSRLRQRNALDPVDWIDLGVARIAIGLDPVADRFLANLLRYAASQKNHEVHPLIDQPIQWGNYASERGVITGPLNGLVVNTTWVRPPTNPSAKPLTQQEGAWNTRPGDQFSPHGRSPLGPYGYSTGSTLRDLNPDSEIGTGVFWVRIPAGKKNMATVVENPTEQPLELSVGINGGPASKTEIPAGKTITVNAALPQDKTALAVRYTGSKKLVLLKTSFE